MISWKYLESILKDCECSIESGRVFEALERLNFLLGQVDSSEPENALRCATILHLMSRAATELGDEEGALRFLNRAVDILRETTPASSPEQVEVFLGLAHSLASQCCYKEAMHFAEVTLECVSLKLEDFPPDELADILRRYADIARCVGLVEQAHVSLTLALLLIHHASGLESEVATELLSRRPYAWERASSSAIRRVGEFVAGY